MEKLSEIQPPVLSTFFSDKNCTARNPALLSLMPDTNLISQTEIDQHLERLYCLKTCELLEYYPEYVEFSFFYLHTLGISFQIKSLILKVALIRREQITVRELFYVLLSKYLKVKKKRSLKVG